MILRILTGFLMGLRRGKGEIWGPEGGQRAAGSSPRGTPGITFCGVAVGRRHGRSWRTCASAHPPQNPLPGWFSLRIFSCVHPKNSLHPAKRGEGVLRLLPCQPGRGCSGCSVLQPARGFAPLAGFCVRCRCLRRVRGFASGARFCTACGVLHRVQGFAPGLGFCTGRGFLHRMWGFAPGAGFFAPRVGYCAGRRVLHQAQGFARGPGFRTGRRVLRRTWGFAPVTGFCARVRTHAPAPGGTRGRG